MTQPQTQLLNPIVVLLLFLILQKLSNILISFFTQICDMGFYVLAIWTVITGVKYIAHQISTTSHVDPHPSASSSEMEQPPAVRRDFSGETLAEELSTCEAATPQLMGMAPEIDFDQYHCENHPPFSLELQAPQPLTEEQTQIAEKSKSICLPCLVELGVSFAHIVGPKSTSEAVDTDSVIHNDNKAIKDDQPLIELGDTKEQQVDCPEAALQLDEETDVPLETSNKVLRLDNEQNAGHTDQDDAALLQTDSSSDRSDFHTSPQAQHKKSSQDHTADTSESSTKSVDMIPQPDAVNTTEIPTKNQNANTDPSCPAPEGKQPFEQSLPSVEETSREIEMNNDTSPQEQYMTEQPLKEGSEPSQNEAFDERNSLNNIGQPTEQTELLTAKSGPAPSELFEPMETATEAADEDALTDTKVVTPTTEPSQAVFNAAVDHDGLANADISDSERNSAHDQTRIDQETPENLSGATNRDVSSKTDEKKEDHNSLAEISAEDFFVPVKDDGQNLNHILLAGTEDQKRNAIVNLPGQPAEDNTDVTMKGVAEAPEDPATTDDAAMIGAGIQDETTLSQQAKLPEEVHTEAHKSVEASPDKPSMVEENESKKTEKPQIQPPKTKKDTNKATKRTLLSLSRGTILEEKFTLKPDQKTMDRVNKQLAEANAGNLFISIKDQDEGLGHIFFPLMSQESEDGAIESSGYKDTLQENVIVAQEEEQGDTEAKAEEQHGPEAPLSAIESTMEHTQEPLSQANEFCFFVPIEDNEDGLGHVFPSLSHATSDAAANADDADQNDRNNQDDDAQADLTAFGYQTADKAVHDEVIKDSATIPKGDETQGEADDASAGAKANEKEQTILEDIGHESKVEESEINRTGTHDDTTRHIVQCEPLGGTLIELEDISENASEEQPQHALIEDAEPEQVQITVPDSSAPQHAVVEAIATDLGKESKQPTTKSTIDNDKPAILGEDAPASKQEAHSTKQVEDEEQAKPHEGAQDVGEAQSASSSSTETGDTVVPDPKLVERHREEIRQLISTFPSEQERSRLRGIVMGLLHKKWPLENIVASLTKRKEMSKKIFDHIPVTPPSSPPPSSSDFAQLDPRSPPKIDFAGGEKVAFRSGSTSPLSSPPSSPSPSTKKSLGIFPEVDDAEGRLDKHPSLVKKIGKVGDSEGESYAPLIEGMEERKQQADKATPSKKAKKNKKNKKKGRKTTASEPELAVAAEVAAEPSAGAPAKTEVDGKTTEPALPGKEDEKASEPEPAKQIESPRIAWDEEVEEEIAKKQELEEPQIEGEKTTSTPSTTPITLQPLQKGKSKQNTTSESKEQTGGNAGEKALTKKELRALEKKQAKRARQGRERAERSKGGV
ncbi:uncharacterized protein KY384_003928 [Bacidia gigantensis]|uniref:uncharacterized protein n=1 Tax=Bacidia gigantensis TaxID=2732470 RepID=UPI001D03D95B|nr:uncharacterized protein KY384_003928 [Bacidia gigantensis]KAG8532287.1 hypothetical protein KY384_003928 [Bacidia gigantensis]